MRDPIALQRLESELALNEERFKSFFASAPAGLAIIDAGLRCRTINKALARTHGVSASDNLGKSVSELLPELASTIEPVLHRVLTTGQPALSFEASGKTPSRLGVTRHWLASCFPLEGPNGMPDSVGAIVVEISELKRIEEAQQALLRVAEKLNSTLDVDKLLDSLVIEAIRLVQAEGGCAGIRGPEGMVCHKYFRHGVAVPWEYAFPPGHGLPGWLIVHKVPYVTNDARADAQVIPAVRDRLGFSSAISAPLLDPNGEPLGFFEIHDRTDRAGFTSFDEHNLVAVSQIASVAVQNALAYRTLQQTKEAIHQLSGRLLRLQDEERRRVARELHDTTAQGLAALVMNLNAVKRSARGLSPGTRRALHESVALATEASQQVRTQSYLLHPPMIDEFGLKPALGWFVRGFRRRSGIQVALEISSQVDRLPRNIETTIFRVLQEALTNVHRHSGAKRVSVRLRRQGSAIVLTVKDWGRGMPPATVNTMERDGEGMGVGIPGMRERTKLVAGELKIQSTRRGTTVTATLPVPNSWHEELAAF